MIQPEATTIVSPRIRTLPGLTSIPWARLFAPVDIASLVVFRFCFGAIMLWEVGRYFAYGWIKEHYIDPTFYFTYFGFGWVKPWQGAGMNLHFLLLGALAVCIMIGLWYRLAVVLFFLGFSYVALLDQTHYLNHFYLISLMSFLMIFVPAHRALSIDARHNPSLRSDIAPRWTLWLLRVQLGIVYFFGGIAKLNGDWLRGEPMRIWLVERTDFSLIGRWFTEEWMVYLFSYGGLLFDLLFVPLVLWRRTRWLALAVGFIFHLTNARLFNIGIFPWFMLAASLLFLDPSWPRETILFRLWSRRQHPDSSLLPERLSEKDSWRASSLRQLNIHQRVKLILLGLYVAWQIVMPLRHFLYPGNVSWTEQGHHFAWHMKLRDKKGDGLFIAKDVATGTTWQVDLAQYINREQFSEMILNPEMILQFAHHIAAERRRAGEDEVEVHAWVEVSLNGRPPQLLVDPDVNLAAEPRTLLAADWILPLTE